MNNLALTSAAALDSQFEIQNIISLNVANVNTPGFKRRVTATESRELPFRTHLEHANSKLSIPKTRSGVDFSQGDIRQTGNPLDVALDGKGFIKINTPDGIRYTRSGNFSIDKDGKITTQHGDPIVLRDGGASVSASGGPLSIFKDGTIQQGTVKLGRLDVVSFEDPRVLISESGTQFIAPEGVEEKASDAIVNQGALEGSNVNAVNEFISMISVARAAEASTRFLRQADEMMRKSVEK